MIGLSLLIASSGRLLGVAMPLVYTGQMALSLHVAHVILGLGTFDYLGMGRGQGTKLLTFAILICWLCSVVFATVWRRFCKRGPLEILMRVLTG